MKKITILALCIVLGACSTSVDSADSASTRSEPTTTLSGTTSTPAVSSEAGRPDTLETHLAGAFASMFDENSDGSLPNTPAENGSCVAREVIDRLGGSAALAKAGITAESSTDQIGRWIGSMLQDRITGKNAEPFDDYVDAMWACGFDEVFAAEFRKQLQQNGNTGSATECLVSRVIDDRYLRLVLVIGTRTGSTPDPAMKHFGDGLVSAVDDAARDCGGVIWGGS